MRGSDLGMFVGIGLFAVVVAVVASTHVYPAADARSPTELCYESGFSVGYASASRPEAVLRARAAVEKIKRACGVPG